MEIGPSAMFTVTLDELELQAIHQAIATMGEADYEAKMFFDAGNEVYKTIDNHIKSQRMYAYLERNR